MRLYRNVIYLDDGSTKAVRKIGQGMFAKAYVTTQGRTEVYVLVREGCGDYAKEILASLNRAGFRSPHVPRVHCVGETRLEDVYRMPLYRMPLRKADSPRAWAQYRAIERCWKKAIGKVEHQHRGTVPTYEGYSVMWATVECATVDADVSPGLVRALTKLMNAAENYGSDWTFEFSPRSLGTTPRGNLILLDVLFSLEALRRRPIKVRF